MDVRMFTVGPVQENCFLIRRDGASEALIVDPGEEAPKLLAAIDALGVDLAGILLTHTHFDHVGAVAPVARATGAEVWVPTIEKGVLADIMSFVPWSGFGPFESYDAEHVLGVIASHRATAPATSRSRSPTSRRSSRATSSSRDRSVAPTCRAATAPR
jgi:hypothetical protein